MLLLRNRTHIPRNGSSHGGPLPCHLADRAAVLQQMRTRRQKLRQMGLTHKVPRACRNRTGGTADNPPQSAPFEHVSRNLQNASPEPRYRHIRHVLSAVSSHYPQVMVHTDRNQVHMTATVRTLLIQ